MVKGLQDILKELRAITTELDNNVSGLKEFLDEKEFIPDYLGEKITDYLEKIRTKQEEFVSKYEALGFHEVSRKYTVLENELSKLQSTCEEDAKYIEAVKFF